MYLTEKACQVSGVYHRNSGLAPADEVRLIAGEVEEPCGSGTQIAVHAARFTKPRLREIIFSCHHQDSGMVLFTKVYGEPELEDSTKFAEMQ
jgi:hypothetical protein